MRNTIVETLAAQNNDPVVPLRDRAPVPGDLEGVILRCLAKDPDTRFRDIRQLESALAACVSADGWTSVSAAALWQSLPSVEASLEGAAGA